MTILVTGAAGFIGFHVSLALLDEGRQVIGIDNLNDYYDVNLKKNRLTELQKSPQFSFQKIDITDSTAVNELFMNHKISQVIHLAGQPGVRYSLQHPEKYIQANLLGFFHILEACRQHKVEHFIYASSSSVYGANTAQPFSEHANTDHPMSLYAATKKSNELMAHSYASLYKLPSTGLRFFTVYGPWGRPDMALSLFTRAILDGKPIPLFNQGEMQRDFTYIDDAVNAVMLALNHPASSNLNWSGKSPDPASSYAPYQIYNVGNNKPVNLMQYINAIEQASGKKALIEPMAAQAGDLMETCANIELITHDLGYQAKTDIQTGINQFVKWYKQYYKL